MPDVGHHHPNASGPDCRSVFPNPNYEDASVAAVPANCGWVLLENHGPRDQSASLDLGMHITIPQPLAACPLPAEQRCAILTDDSPNLGLANDPTPADATARSRPDASAGTPQAQMQPGPTVAPRRSGSGGRRSRH